MSVAYSVTNTKYGCSFYGWCLEGQRIGLQTTGKGIGGRQPATTDMEITNTGQLGVTRHVAA